MPVEVRGVVSPAGGLSRVVERNMASGGLREASRSSSGEFSCFVVECGAAKVRPKTPAERILDVAQA